MSHCPRGARGDRAGVDKPRDTGPVKIRVLRKKVSASEVAEQILGLGSFLHFYFKNVVFDGRSF